MLGNTKNTYTYTENSIWMAEVGLPFKNGSLEIKQYIIAVTGSTF
jgi:hypothetical protein